MAQRHAQFGIFHITTNAQDAVPWLTIDGVPDILIDNLLMTRTVYGGQVYAFCVLPDHMHIILSPGEKGLSKFMQSFKRNSSKDARIFLDNRAGKRTRAAKYGYIGLDDFDDATMPIALMNVNNSCQFCRSRGSFTPAHDPITFSGWHNGFHDERIRDGNQCSNAVYYVQGNGVKHGYVSEILDWKWTSLHFEHRLDPMEIWLD